jgi:quinoprotein glucose dehydrogenase
VKSSVSKVDYHGEMTPVETMQGVPLSKPPYGRITAIDLNTGDHRWMTPVDYLAKAIPSYDIVASGPSGGRPVVTCS